MFVGVVWCNIGTMTSSSVPAAKRAWKLTVSVYDSKTRVARKVSRSRETDHMLEAVLFHVKAKANTIL